jgi:ribosomal protein L40E
MTKYCPKCGAPNPDDAVYCTKCGYKFLPEATEQPAKEQKKEVAQVSLQQTSAQPSPETPKQVQTKPSGQKSRLGVWLIIGLIVGLLIAGIPAMYFYQQSQYYKSEVNYLNSSYASLQSSYSSLQSQYSSLKSSYSSLQSQYSSLQSSYSSLQSIVSLSDSSVFVNQQTVSEPAGSSYSWTFNVNYAGYIVVYVSSSTTSNTYVEISGYSNNGISYNSGHVTIGTSGSVAYPVLPGSVIVYVGNTNLFSGATETVTITYYY